jgi:hypothetical protein
MQTQVIAVVAFFIISAPAIMAQPRSALAGSWKSAPEELKLSTDFDKSVWGPNATSVRSVALVIQGSGLGVLTVTRKVVDGRRRTVAASMSIEEAHIQIGDPQRSVAGRVEHDVRVLAAERKYPDDPGDHWPLEGLRVKVATFDDGDENTLEVRFEPADGRGSFSETLRRERRGAAHRTSG